MRSRVIVGIIFSVYYGKMREGGVFKMVGVRNEKQVSEVRKK